MGMEVFSNPQPVDIACKRWKIFSYSFGGIHSIERGR